MIQVKICGINDAQSFDAVVDSGADYVGFNFFPPSPRAVSPAQAASLSKLHAGGPIRVGLFVDPSEGDIAAVLAEIPLEILQLYMPAPRAVELGARFGLPIWRPVGVETTGDLPTSCDGADHLLIETKPPAGATRPGGNAAIFDWSILAGWAPPCAWALAGGLTPGNVAEAIRATHTTLVDVSSGVERARGQKDSGLIRRFIENARNA